VENRTGAGGTLAAAAVAAAVPDGYTLLINSVSHAAVQSRKIIGGIGVSGVMSHQDAQVARAGLAALS